MGLDMFLYVQEKEAEKAKELFYWRKVREIHNLMEVMWREESDAPNDVDFNLIEYDLDKPKLDTLEMYLLNPDTHIKDSGFFFGDWDMDDSTIQDTLGVIRTAKEEVEKGNRVFYTSWW